MLFVMVASAFAGKPAVFTARPAKWKDVDVECTSEWVVGPTTDTAVYEGGVAGLVDAKAGISERTRWPAKILARPLDAGYRVNLASTTRGPLDLAGDRRENVGYAAAFAEMTQFAPQARIDAGGKFLGIIGDYGTEWDGAAKTKLIVGRLGANGWDGLSMLTDFQVKQLDPWASGAAEAGADRWSLVFGRWIGRTVGEPPVETPGPNGASTASAEASAACGPKVKSCVAVQVVSRAAAPLRSDVTRAWLDAKTMQVYGWSAETWSGSLDSSEGHEATGEGRRVACLPAK